MSGAAFYLSYPDAAQAIRWLEALGFGIVRRQDDGDRVVHAELRRDDVVLMVASDDAEYVVAPLRGASTGAGVYLITDSVDDEYGRAIGAGATAILEPEDTEWGARRARVLDPGGREWSFGSYRPGEAW